MLLINKKTLDGINLQLFNNEEPVIDLAIQTGENSAKVEATEEAIEEIEDKIEEIESRSRWNDQSIDSLRETVYDLQSRVDTMEKKEEIEEENEPGIHEKQEDDQKEDDETETVIEEVEEKVGVEKGSNLALVIGTLIFGTVSVFLIKMYESRTGGMKE